MTLRVVNWNVQWATPRSKRSPDIVSSISKLSPDVVCLTETNQNLLSNWGGHTICSKPDYGHKIVKGRRKVMLWSAQPWRDIDCIGDYALPPGRFVSGVTKTPIGETMLIGVCIPWSGSRTRRFSGPQRQWQDHEEYLDALTTLLPRLDACSVVVLGDFNQPIGQRTNVPVRLRDKLQAAFSPRFDIPTALLNHHGKSCIDHIALGPGLSHDSLDTISHIGSSGQPLSDHFGVTATLTTQTQPISNHSEE